MRDVSRMLDAMEAEDPAAVAITIDAAPADLPPLVGAAASPTAPTHEDAQPSGTRVPWPFVAAGAATACAAGIAALAFRRRRTKPKPITPPPSIVSLFAQPKPIPPPRVAPPTWVYRSSPFETPDLEVVAEPVDLLVPFASRTELPPQGTLREKLAAADPHGSLHLIGDKRFPDIRCTGEADDSQQAWQAILEAASRVDDDDRPLARWLLPSLCVLRARRSSRRDAEHFLALAEHMDDEAGETRSDEERRHAFARSIRIRLARATRLSGATRLFAVRDLLAEVMDDSRCEDALALDACIDVQLAWSSWLFGDAASTRLAEAERTCDRLGHLGPDAATRALRRRGEVWLRRAQMRKPSARLPDLERAQSLLDDAHDRQPCAETALLVAQVAQQRARLVPAEDAAAACSHALLHAFLAEQDPAWRVDALVCRLDIQLTYEALPEQATQERVTAAIGRSLEAAGAVPSSARVTVAEARLHDGDYAGAAGICESIWRDHATDARVLDLWRDACRRWGDDTDHDAGALAQALRRLAIARSTF